MKNNPRLDIYLDKIKKNAKYINNLCVNQGIGVVGITKGCSAIPKVARAMADGGIKILGDSRIENIKRLKEAGIKTEMMLVRIPMFSEVEKVIEWSDISLNSEIEVIKRLSESAQRRNIVHKIILMVDMGDLREGVMPKDAVKTVEKIGSLSGVKLIGIGVNFCCASGIMPTAKNLSKLVKLAEEIENKFQINLEIISGGSTNVLKLIEDNILPQKINQLRIGVGILLGQDDVRLRNLAGTYQDTFILTGEVVELKIKPSMPKGEIGRDAFGAIPSFKDLGLRKRAILALGKQDIRLSSIIPLKEGLKIITASSDHVIVDVTDFKEDIKVGSEIQFKLNYPALLATTTSKYINKYFYKEEKR